MESENHHLGTITKMIQGEIPTDTKINEKNFKE